MKKDAPKLSSQVQCIPRCERYIFIHPNIPQWIVTNELGKLVLTLFDGSNSINEIIETATEGLGESNRKSIETFCNKIMESGLLSDHDPKHKTHRFQLSSVHLSLSENCNLRCVYCYASKREEQQYPKLKLDEYYRIIDDIIEINPDVTFTLTGGEPLLNPSCLKIAQYIKDNGCRTLLLTNGTLINKDNIKSISELFSLVTISMDGPNPEIHSLSRGDNFEKVTHAIELLESNNVEYTISMTVTRKNIKYVEEMAKKFGSHLNFAPYFPIEGDRSELAVSGDEYYQALKNAAGVNPLNYCENTLRRSKSTPIHKCAIGDGEFSISATGDVYPCQLLHVKSLYAGNTHVCSIKDIYHNSQAIAQCSRLDVDNIKGCRDCPIKYICGGSCRARAYYECGDIESSSDFCKYEQEAFYDGIIKMYSQNILEQPE